MKRRPQSRRLRESTRPWIRRLGCERLERRYLLALPPCLDGCLEIELIPEVDQFGSQVETVQVYGDGDDGKVTFALYDTGASVVTFSAADQLLFELLGSPIPIKVPGGAEADAIGGKLIGDVSQPDVLMADGLHAVDIDSNFNITLDLSNAARAEGVQAFVGDPTGSPFLPTITGTPIHNPSTTHPAGNAAKIDMEAYEVDFGELFPEIPEFKDIVLFLPDLSFVEPGTQLTPPADGSVLDPVRVPLGLFGDDNHLAPGDMITNSYNPVHTLTHVYQGDAEVEDITLLFDTGAQLSVVSTEVALGLELDLNNPQTVIDVFGAGGTTQIPGYTIDALELARDDDGDGVVDGVLRWTNVPIYVLDIIDGLDGILGMNLFNPAASMLYDPFDPAGPSMSVGFLAERQVVVLDDTEQSAVNSLAAVFPAFVGAIPGQGAPAFQVDADVGWQNPVNKRDVNGDGHVTSRDVGVVINDLNRNGPRQLPDPPIRFSTRPFFPDVDKDGFETPTDVRILINFINQQVLPENESIAAIAPHRGADGLSPAPFDPRSLQTIVLPQPAAGLREPQGDAEVKEPTREMVSRSPDANLRWRWERGAGEASRLLPDDAEATAVDEPAAWQLELDDYLSLLAEDGLRAGVARAR